MDTTFVRIAMTALLCISFAACDIEESDPTGPGEPLAMEPQSTHLGFRGQWDAWPMRFGRATGCAIGQDDGLLACWGRNDHGQLGIGHRRSRSIPVHVSSTRRWISVDTHDSHTCAVRDNGAAYCWGANDRGQLGDGTTTERLRPVLVGGGRTYVGIRVGADHSCAVQEDGDMYCWGDNSRGQLGNGTGLGSFARTPVLVGGGHDWQFTIFSPESAPELSDDRTCAIDTDDVVYCWGINRSTGTQSATPARAPGTLRFAEISVTGFNTCGITREFELYCWGNENNANPQPTLLGSSYFGLTNLCASNFDSEALLCWDEAYDPVRVAAQHGGLGGGLRMDGGQIVGGTICARVGVLCWGEGSEGQIGDGWREDRTVETPVVPPGELPRVHDLRVTATTDTSMTLTWTETYISGEEPARYRVKTGPNRGFDHLVGWSSARVVCSPTIRGMQPGATISCTAHGFEPDERAFFQLASFGVEDGAWVDVSFSNVAGGTAGATRVRDLHVEAVTSTSITLEWTQVDDGTGNPARYRVKYGAPYDSWSGAPVGCNVTGTEIGAPISCTVTGLSPNTGYGFQLMSYRLVNGSWAGAEFSNIVETITED